MRVVGLILTAVVVAGCGERPGMSPLAERGRQVYLAQCTACHGSDPAQPGPLGPAVKGSARELLEAKVLRGTYPPGYQPKRPTTVMPPQPALAPEIAALTEYLK
jgi:mono/diheme cytochrome c family protein